MTVIVKHNKTNTITDWTQAQLDEQIALGNFPSGTTLANIVLPSDWNNDHTLTGVGTMAEQDANSVAITGGTINNTTIGATTATTGRFTSVTTPSVTATTTDLTLSAISTGTVKLQTANGIAFTARDNGTTVANYISSVGTSGVPYLVAEGTGTNVSTAFSSKGTGSVSLWTNNASQVQFQATHTASAVNYVQVTGAATGGSVVLSAQGSDGNIPFTYRTKGTFNHNFQTGAGTTTFVVNQTGGSANYNETASSATGFATTLKTLGTDTNISMAFQPKGTGAIDLAAGSSGVNISNGGTVTAITVTNNGATAYTSHPTPAITAPTTAGGVQAVATSNMYYNSALASTTIVNGGTGYTVGNSLTVSGGTFTAAATFTVSSVSGGVVTAITPSAGGTYSVIPTGTLSVTGGSGTGFTFTINGWAVRSLNITNAGSGYIEQPTITFSGGGGSGAAAYATVGSIPTVKTLGSAMSFNVPSGEVLRLSDGASAACYLNLQSSSTTIQTFASGAGANIGFQQVTKGISNHSFATNNSVANEQFRIAHTASAVNYVQVTGAATTSPPIISAQGSDTNIALRLYSKGTNAVSFWTNNGGARQFQINHTAGTIANYAQVTGNIAGSAPSFSVDGTDTNIDLALTPKGTGLVRFGTYTAGALTATGYINIKAADGTTYKVLVST
jgi:hypothetical protein